jgi:dCMP deaminase
MRLEREEYFKEVARLTAKRSTCLRRQVGCVIVRGARIAGLGYNGAPSGFPHCTPETCNEEQPCTATIHAEANAIVWAHGPLSGAVVYCTDEPCLECSKLIVSAGITTVHYDRPYRVHEGRSILWEAGVEVHRF